RVAAGDDQAVHAGGDGDPAQARAAGLLARIPHEGREARRRLPRRQEVSGLAVTDEAPKGLPKRGALISVRLSTNEKVKPHHHVPSTWPAPVRAIAALSRFLAVLEGVGIGACLLAVVGLATWQFIERNLTQHHLPFFHVPPWTDGVIRHSVFMLGFLGGAYATYTGRHIRIDAVTRVVKAKKRMLLRAFTTLAAMIIVGLITKAAIDFRKITLQESGEASQSQELFTPARGALIMVI